MWRSPYQIRGNWPRSSLTMRFFEEINIEYASYFHVCKYTKKSQWSVQRSSLGQATNKRLTDHWINNNIFYETFSISPVDNVLGEVFHVQVQKDAKYLRKLMFLLWLWLCHMIRWIIAANMMYSFFNCWQTHMWSGVFSRSLTREKTLRIWMLLCHLQSGENTNIPWY